MPDFVFYMKKPEFNKTVLSNGLTVISEKIAKTCARIGRPVDSVQLLAVCKGQPAEKIKEAVRTIMKL